MNKLLTATILAGWILTPSVSMADIPFLNGGGSPREYTPKSNCQMFTFPACHWSGAAAASSTYIQSIQLFEITIGASASSNTATISSVTTSRTAIFYDWFTTTNTGTTLRQFATGVTLTNSTTVTANRGTTDASSVVARGYVVEYKAAAVSSVQYGQITLADTVTSNTAAISSVTTTRSCVLHLGSISDSTNATTTDGNVATTLTLTSSTVVTADRDGNSGIVYAKFCVIEWATGIIKSNQSFSITLTSGTTTANQTITSVNTANTLLIWQGSRCTSAQEVIFVYTAELSSSTNILLTRGGTSITSRVINVTALEFASGVLSQSVQRGVINMDSATSVDATISSVSTSRAFTNYCGYRLATNYNADVRSTTIKLLNSTTVRGERTGASVAGTQTFISYEVPEFT